MQPSFEDHVEQISRHSLASAAGVETISGQMESALALLRAIEQHDRTIAKHTPAFMWCAWIALALLAAIAWR